MSLRDFTSTISAKLKGKQYHNNLLGASLEELVRQATAKNLTFPDDELNQQVVFAINSEAGTVRDPKEVCTIMKKRLAMDNPQKQLLAVLLVQKVLQECTVLAPYTAELLQDVARVYAKTAKGDPTSVINAKNAAKELLRRYGTAGQDAFRAVSRLPHMAHRPTVVNAAYVVPENTQGQPPMTAETRAAERASLIDEVQRMVDHARGHTELLNDMLVNSGGTTDDFERAMMRELVQDVADMRTMFTSYLEQLGGLEGPDVEKLMCAALEAVDQLDNALTLVKDVEAEVAQVGSPTQAASVPAAAAAPAPKVIETNLIDLDDLAEALPPVATTTAAAASSAAQDPFAPSTSGAAAAADPFASAGDPFGSAPPEWTASPTAAAAAAAAPAAAPAAPAAPATQQPASPPAMAAPTPAMQPQHQPQPQQVGYGQPMGMPGQPGFPYQPNMMMPQQPGYGMPAYMPQQTGYMAQQTGGYMAQPTGGYMGMMVGSPQQQFMGSPPSPYMMMQQRPAMPQQQMPYGSPSANNPFAAQAANPYKPPGAAAAPDAMAALNPFASKPAAQPAVGVPMAQAAAQNNAAVEADWNMFFADRVGGAAQQPVRQ